MLRRAFDDVPATTHDRPTLIIVDSHIGYGAPHKQDTGAAPRRAARRGGGPAHQARLRLARGRASSSCPTASASTSRAGIGERGHDAARGVDASCSSDYKAKHPELADELERMQHRELPDGLGHATCPTFPADAKGVAGRDASGKVLNAIARNVPWLIGGAADLAPSTKTRLTFDGAGDFEADDHGGRNLHFGIREHAMGAIAERHVAVEGARRSARAS